MFSAILISLRPRQWLKNLFVFAPLIFAREFTDPEALKITLLAFMIFCLTASGVYVVNDIFDRSADQAHPKKKLRPIAAGKLSVNTALLISIVLLATAILWSRALQPDFGLIISGYIALQIAYSLALKHLAGLDILTISFGFVLRVLAGATVIEVPASTWLIIVTFLLTLLLASSKRRQELKLVNGKSLTRQTLSQYNPRSLDTLIHFLILATFISYTAYTLQPGQPAYLFLTTPITAYGFWRYLLLLRRKEVLDMPEEFIFADRNFAGTIMVWVLAVILIMAIS